MSSGILILAGAELIFAGARRAWLRCGGYSVPAHIINHCQEQGKRSFSYGENVEEGADWYCVMGAGAGFLSL